ncbi:MAG TPA: DUF1801 domain-containing protein [Pyrinomonadaceae bacterium]
MSREFDDFISSYQKEVQAIARQVRDLIFQVAPGVSEHVYPAMKVIRYGLEGNKMAGLVFFLMPLKDRVNLGFNHGTSLPDPKGLLEGTGKNLRHVKLKNVESVRAPALRALLKAELSEAKRLLQGRS